MYQNNKSCLFRSDYRYRCSKQRIVVNVIPSTKSRCNQPIANVTFKLPDKFGSPYVRYCFQPNSSERCKFVSDFQELHRRNYSFNLNVSLSALPYRIAVTGENCRSEYCPYNINSSFFANCSNLEFVSGENRFKDEDASHTTAIAALSASVGFLCLVLFALVARFFAIKLNTKCTKMSKDLTSSDIFLLNSSSSVFVVFVDEHPNHRNVVLKFFTFLKAHFGLNVFLYLYNQEEIYANPVAWLEKAFTADIVLMIWSSGAQERWHNPQNFTDKLDLFAVVSKQVRSDLILKRNVSKYLLAYFDYCNDFNIPRDLTDFIPHYRLLSECNNLLLSMMEANTKMSSDITKSALKKYISESIANDSSGYYSSLEASVVDMRTVAKHDPLRWTTKHLSRESCTTKPTHMPDCLSQNVHV